MVPYLGPVNRQTGLETTRGLGRDYVSCWIPGSALLQHCVALNGAVHACEKCRFCTSSCKNRTRSAGSALPKAFEKSALSFVADVGMTIALV